MRPSRTLTRDELSVTLNGAGAPQSYAAPTISADMRYSSSPKASMAHGSGSTVGGVRGGDFGPNSPKGGSTAANAEYSKLVPSPATAMPAPASPHAINGSGDGAFGEDACGTTSTTSAAPAAHRPRLVPAPVEAHSADGQRTLQGPTTDGGWQTLTFLPQVEALRYEARSGSSRRKQLHLCAVSVARWEALARTATLSAWQASVSRLLNDAVKEHRATELM